MRFNAQSYLLSNALTQIDAIDPSNPDAIKLKANKQNNSVTFFALGRWGNDCIYVTCPAVVEQEGEICISDARKFCKLVSGFESDISFQLKENSFIVKNKRRVSKFRVYEEGIPDKNIKDFSSACERANTINLPSFLGNCLKMKPFQSPDEFKVWREVIRIIMSPKDSKIILDLAEGSTFCRCSMESEIKNDMTDYIMVRNIMKAYMIFKGSEDGHFVKGNGYTCISDSTAYYFINETNIEYPNVDRIWRDKLSKKKFTTSIYLEEIISCLKNISIIVRGEMANQFEIKPMSMTFGPNNILRIEVEELYDEEINYSGEGANNFTALYSPTRLLEVFKNMTGDVVYISAIHSENERFKPVMVSDNSGLNIVLSNYLEN